MSLSNIKIIFFKIIIKKLLAKVKILRSPIIWGHRGSGFRNSNLSFKKCVDLGVDGIYSSFPEKLIDLRAKR